ncbi:MAG: hypothetical protein E7480_03400 [Ruminococcaceae bacterium]|nr:hypothetical protein [Oscillospiraceae bacterium]
MKFNFFKKSQDAPPGGTVRHFWLYALILFSFALALMMIGQYLQTQELKQVQSSLQIEEQEGQNKVSALQTVQQLNKELSSQVAQLNEQLAEAKGDIASAQYDISVLEKKIEQMSLIIEAQNLYYSGKYWDGKQKLKELPEEEVLEDLVELYQTVKKRLR